MSAEEHGPLPVAGAQIKPRWRRLLVRGLGWITVQWSTKTALFLAGIGFDPVPPFDCLDNGVAYFAAANRVAWFASLVIAAIWYTWRETIDPILPTWRLPWKIVRREA